MNDSVWILERSYGFTPRYLAARDQNGAIVGVFPLMLTRGLLTKRRLRSLPITPVGGEPFYWLGVWFGVYPSWETLGAQLVAGGFVLGSFFVAKELKVRRPGRRAARRAVPAQPTREPVRS